MAFESGSVVVADDGTASGDGLALLCYQALVDFHPNSARLDPATKKTMGGWARGFAAAFASEIASRFVHRPVSFAVPVSFEQSVTFAGHQRRRLVESTPNATLDRNLTIDANIGDLFCVDTLTGDRTWKVTAVSSVAPDEVEVNVRDDAGAGAHSLTLVDDAAVTIATLRAATSGSAYDARLVFRRGAWRVLALDRTS